jgi:ribonuclease HI
MVFYAVANGRTTGIFMNWTDCKNSIHGYKSAIYKKFDRKEDAEMFVLSNNKNSIEHNIAKTTIESFFGIKPVEKPTEDTIEFIPDYYVYTDGSCVNNGKPNACAGIGIFFNVDDPRNVSKRVDGKQSNNTAEISAVIETFFIIENDIQNGKKIGIVTDSKYVIKCVSSYGEKCNKKNWNLDMPNKELVKQAYELYKNKPNVKFIHIKAHTNNTDIHSIGNDNADKLANNAIGFENCPYQKSPKIYLIVPFIKKDEVKKLGGMWDPYRKKWYIYEDNKNKEYILSSFPKETYITEDLDQTS